MVWLDGEKAYWREIEEWVCEYEGWTDVHKRTHDALTDELEKVEIKSVDINNEIVKIWEKQEEESDYMAIVTRESDYLCRYMLFDSDILNYVKSNVSIRITNDIKYLRSYNYNDIYGYVEVMHDKDIRRNEFVSKL